MDDTEDPYADIDNDRDLGRRFYEKLAIQSLEGIVNKKKETPGTKTISKSFAWSDAPELEEIVKKPETVLKYFELHNRKKEGKSTQPLEEFKDELLRKLLAAIQQHGYVTEEEVTKQWLRKRIVTYYHTTIQGARLRVGRARKRAVDDTELLGILEQCRREQAREEAATKRHREDDLLVDESTWRKKATVPLFGSYEWRVLQLLQNSEPISSFQSYPAINTSNEPDIVGLRTLVRIRLTSGIFRSSIKLCHDMLQRMYQQAAVLALEREANNKPLKDLRENLVLVWCYYSELFVKVSSLEADNGEELEPIIKPDEWKRYALATLSDATGCRFVGNHEMLAVALSRLIVGGQQENMSSLTMEEVRSALAACQDGLRRAQSLTEPKAFIPASLQSLDFQRISNHSLKIDALKEDPVTVADLETSFQAVRNLPKVLESSPDMDHFWIDAEEATPTITAEITRLQEIQKRLGIHLGVNTSLSEITTADVPHEQPFAVERPCTGCSNVFLSQNPNHAKCARCRETEVEETDL